MEFVVQQLPAQPVVYKSRTGPFGSENYKLMEEMKEWAEQRGLLQNGTLYGIAHGNERTPPQECRYDVCLVVENCPTDSSVQQGVIPGGQYAVFTVAHTAQAIQAFWASVLQMLQQKGLHLNSAKPILERYQYALIQEGKCEFCVPLL